MNGFLRFLPVALLAKAALVLMLLLPTPARASDIGDCLASTAKSAIPVGELKAAADFFSHPENIPCVSLMSDPTGQFQALVAVLAAMKVAGAFDSADQCKGLAGTLAAEVTLAIADRLGFDVPEEARANAAKLAEWAANNALGSVVKTEWDCGCAVAVYGIQGLETTLGNLETMAESCGAVIGQIAEVVADAVGAIIAGFVDFFNDFADGLEGAWHLAFGGDDLPTTTPPPDLNPACYPPMTQSWCQPDAGAYCSGSDPKPTYYKCETGKVCRCEPGENGRPKLCVYWDSTKLSCGIGQQCGATAAYVGWHNSTPMGSKQPWTTDYWRSWVSCVSCDTVANATAVSDGVCGCKNGYEPVYQTGPSGKKTLTACTCPAPMQEGSYFGSEKQCRCPSFGQIPRKVGGKLICDCADNAQLDNGLCRACTENERYDGANLRCVACPGGQKADADHKVCVAACTRGAIWDIATKSCKACTGNTIAVHSIDANSIGKCEACPSGLIAIGGRVCGCPVGQRLRNGKCRAGVGPSPGEVGIPEGFTRVPPIKGRPVRRDCAALGRNFINSPRNAQVCIKCAPGKVANESRTACIGRAVGPRETLPQFDRGGARPPRAAPGAGRMPPPARRFMGPRGGFMRR